MKNPKNRVEFTLKTHLCDCVGTPGSVSSITKERAFKTHAEAEAFLLGLTLAEECSGIKTKGHRIEYTLKTHKCDCVGTPGSVSIITEERAFKTHTEAEAFRDGVMIAEDCVSVFIKKPLILNNEEL
jgi:dsDNA-binding SOS-regulon protein